MDVARSSQGDGTRPGGLMRLVAAGLTGEGFDVRLPEHEEERRLLISSQDAECTLTVSDWGETELEYSPRPGQVTDPTRLADMASVLLSGQPWDASQAGTRHGHGGLTLKGIVGLELRTRGMTVVLDVCEDEANLDVYADIVATRPGSPDAGQVRIDDSGSLTWQRDPRHADGAGGRDGSYIGEAPSLRVIALDITTTVADAMRQTILAESGPVAPSPAS